METQKIQGFLNRFGFPSNSSTLNGTQKNSHKAYNTNNSFEANYSEFKLEALFLSKKETSEQGKQFDLYSISSINISISRLELKANEEHSPKTHSPLPSFDTDEYWGIEQTSDRLADFVIKGGGNDINRLRQGREGILKGFKEAEEIWGGSLPDISHQTINKALEKIDAKIHELGESVISLAA